MGVAFVGRQAELDALTALPRQARQARGGAAAVVTGAPGSGKTRLLAEVSRRLGGLGFTRIVGYEPVLSVPLAAVGDLLRELGVLGPGPGADGKIGAGAARAASAVAAPDPLRIFEAAHRARIAGGPTVLLVDDLQWIDSLSLGLVHYLLRAAEASRQPLTVIGAARPSGAAAAFRDGVAAVLPDDRQIILELLPLGLDDGLALARTLDPDLDVERATTLWRRAQGSPFWLEALALGRADDPSWVIRGRLAGVGGDAASLLSALGVGARPLAEVELAGLLEWPPERVRYAADELVLRGLVVVTPGGVRFAHDLIREAALADLPAPVARRLHGRFAAWIEADPMADLGLLREALEHRDAAGLPTAELAARVLASPRRRLLGTAGLRLIAAIADRLEPRSPERLALELGLAELATGIGEQETAIERWSRVSERAADPATRRRAELAAASAAYRLGRAAARSHLDRARATGDPGLDLEADAATAIELDALEAGIELWLEHRTADGAASATRALEAAHAMAAAAGGLDGLAGPAIRAYIAALQAASDAATQEARHVDLLPLSQEIETLAGLLDDEAAYVEAVTRVGSGFYLLGRSSDAEPLLRRAWTLAKERILPTEADEAGHWLARSLHAQGLLAEAHAVAQETAELEARLGHGSRYWSRADRLVHTLELSLGDPRTALAALRADAARESDRHHELGIRQTIAEWQARFSGAAAAPDIDAQLAEARTAAAEVGCPRCGHELAIVDAEIQARLGRIEEAELGLARWLAAGPHRESDENLWRHRAETALALARRDGHGAVAAATNTIADAERFGRAGLELWARIDFGRAQELIDRKAAVRAYGEAAALAERIGARGEGRLVAGALRRLGVRAWRRGPDARDGWASAARDGPDPTLDTLSAREREIARWVANGATNAEIAEALVISPKTVERHLTNVFAKLGLRNRAELASRVRGSPDDRGPTAA